MLPLPHFYHQDQSWYCCIAQCSDWLHHLVSTKEMRGATHVEVSDSPAEDISWWRALFQSSWACISKRSAATEERCSNISLRLGFCHQTVPLCFMVASTSPVPQPLVWAGAVVTSLDMITPLLTGSLRQSIKMLLLSSMTRWRDWLLSWNYPRWHWSLIQYFHHHHHHHHYRELWSTPGLVSPLLLV